MARKTDWKAVATLIGLFLAAAASWNSALLYPLKLFVVLLHETGHGLAAVLTGGHIDRIEINPNLGGVCWSWGGNRLLVLSSGYLGSMLFGGLILVSAARSRHDKLIAMGLGAFTLLLVFLFVRNLFGILFGLLFGLALLGAGRLLSPTVNDLLLKFLGLTSCLYAVIDIEEDLVVRTVPGSDAYEMSRELFGSPTFWGLLWMAVSIVVSVILLRIATRR